MTCDFFINHISLHLGPSLWDCHRTILAIRLVLPTRFSGKKKKMPYRTRELLNELSPFLAAIIFLILI